MIGLTANQTMTERPPSVDSILLLPKVRELLDICPRRLVGVFARKAAEHVRCKYLNGFAADVTDRYLEDLVLNEHRLFFSKKMCRVVNASGILLHSGLGRAALPDSALKVISDLMRSSVSLEIDVESGHRSAREEFPCSLLCELSGAESALIVNNNAAAAMLVLHCLSKDKETIVSRGELVEIGGSFRLPEIMNLSGALLREVGCTNRTYLSDYTSAINQNTAALLKVRTSNYRISGFTAEVSSRDLAGLAKSQGLLLLEDLGSASFADMTKFGFSGEVSPKMSLSNGSDIVFFSADKLLAASQAGIILGKKELIKMMKEDSLYRTLRPDKLTLAALNEVLLLHFDADRLAAESPFYKSLALDMGSLAEKGIRLADSLNGIFGDCTFFVRPEDAYAGCGSFPELAIPSMGVCGQLAEKASMFASHLRHYKVPIIARIKNNCVIFDMRTVDENDFEVILGAAEDWCEKSV